MTNEMVETNSQVSPTVQTPIINDLRPCDINLKAITDPIEHEKARQKIDEWVDGIEKDITEILTKHGVTVYQVSILHPGSGVPLLIGHGNLYSITKLAVSAARSLKKQVDSELGV